MTEHLWKFIIVLIVAGMIYCLWCEKTHKDFIVSGFTMKNAIEVKDGR